MGTTRLLLETANMLGQQIIDTNANRSARMGERRE